MNQTHALEMRRISKRFPGVVALSEVSFSVKKGEVHALCGENGAGKSTLMKILAAVYPSQSYEGEILLDGKIQNFQSKQDSKEAGIAIVHQELSLFPELA